jgi:hypothetical protein
LGALLVIFAGSVSALAQVTVRCVPTASVNPSCTDTTTYPTIQAAVTASNPGDAIFVGPGTYNESVTISTNSLSILGAQAGRDARVGRYDPSKESIVDATGKGSAAFWVNANYVVIDGFTVRGGTGIPPGGIFVGAASAGYYWAQILNNIIENNGPGVYLYKPSQSPSAVVEHNLFRNNNAGTATFAGCGIVSSGVTFSVITENKFTGNEVAAIFVVGGNNVTVTNNTSENDGAFVIYGNTSQCLFSHNQGRNFGHKGVLPIVVGSNSIYADAAVDVGPGNSNLVISDNSLEDGEAPINNGIAFTTAFTATPLGSAPHSISVTVKNNEVSGFPQNGIVAEEELVSGIPTGMLSGSFISGNEVRDNGADGIFIAIDNHNISFFDNRAEGNHLLDCNDASTGYGTLGTANAWFNNTGYLSYPGRLCGPGR